MKRSVIMKSIGAVLIILAVVFLSSTWKAGAASNTATMYIEAEGNGEIIGTVGGAITPYSFTITIKRGEAGTFDPSFRVSKAAGEDVTAWFRGKCEPEKNIFALLPVGLTVKTAKAINVGDTTAEFVISGTPYMGSTGWLQIGIMMSVFDGDPNHKDLVEVASSLR
ncbi:MAG: hypothetical protein J6113_08900, partial [Lachnospiraceae bacterium]|nr:hypothetical protein [Lachnospiraceae bacterium]